MVSIPMNFVWRTAARLHCNRDFDSRTIDWGGLW
jgi:hypothetical protein